MSSPAPREPDWYPHPRQPQMLCYWDGQRWTDKVMPATGSAPTTSTGDKIVKAGAAMTVAILALGALFLLLLLL